jgi:hypothetical protein
MSKTIAIRVSDEVHDELEKLSALTGKNKTELITPLILGLIDLPTASDPLEVRVMALETQLTAYQKCVDGSACELAALYTRLDILEDAAHHLDHCFYQDTPDPKPTEISAEPEQIEDKSTPVSSRDSGRAGSSTSELPSDLELAQLIEGVLVPRSTGGYYFRIEDIGKPELNKTIQNQAKLMGFSSQAVKIDGKSTRVWINKSYCKHL